MPSLATETVERPNGLLLLRFRLSQIPDSYHGRRRIQSAGHNGVRLFWAMLQFSSLKPQAHTMKFRMTPSSLEA